MKEEEDCIMSMIEDMMTQNTEESNGDYFVDHVYGKILDPAKVREARRKEMDYIIKMNVYHRVRKPAKRR